MLTPLWQELCKSRGEEYPHIVMADAKTIVTCGEQRAEVLQAPCATKPQAAAILEMRQRGVRVTALCELAINRQPSKHRRPLLSRRQCEACAAKLHHSTH